MHVYFFRSYVFSICARDLPSTRVFVHSACVVIPSMHGFDHFARMVIRSARVVICSRAWSSPLRAWLSVLRTGLTTLRVCLFTLLVCLSTLRAMCMLIPSVHGFGHSARRSDHSACTFMNSTRGPRVRLLYVRVGQHGRGTMVPTPHNTPRQSKCPQTLELWADLHCKHGAPLRACTTLSTARVETPVRMVQGSFAVGSFTPGA